mmetsp:Transcript_2303/g.4901  ORF Transcript_2303/g.4901 Transcript_2303/m.4901 type:complete len:312 (+) Transcript_2303:128-1063(+)
MRGTRFTSPALMAALAAVSSQSAADAFQLGGRPIIAASRATSTVSATRRPTRLYEAEGAASADDANKAAEDALAEADAALQSMSVEEQKETVGNLVADDEWMGLSMELTELVRTSIIQDVKSKTKDFIGKDDYKVGDISKELDSRIKDEVANLRGKDEYELGDLSVALDKMAKDYTMELTGKDTYETGDLSKELDKRVKDSVAQFCGKADGSEYEFGDLTREVNKRVKNRVSEFTGKDEYSFGDISKELENKRQQWVKDTLGEEAAANYEFGDLTKKALTSFTGKDEYEFGDVTKKVLGNLFGPRKRGGKN